MQGAKKPIPAHCDDADTPPIFSKIKIYDPQLIFLDKSMKQLFHGERSRR